MKLSELKYKPFEMECCKNDCANYNKDIRICISPRVCMDLLIHNDLIKTK